MTVSLIITTRERAGHLSRSLRRLSELTAPDEIIVVDDGSVTSCVKSATEGCALRVRYVYNDRPGPLRNPCQPRNLALRLCTSDEVLVTEPEVVFMTDVVAQLVAARVAHPDGVLCEEWAYHEPHENATLDECRRVPGFYAHMAKRRWLLDVGGWDEAVPGPWGWDDIDLWHRLELSGHPRVKLPEVRIRHTYHESRIEPATENEAYVRAKIFPRDLVANKES